MAKHSFFVKITSLVCAGALALALAGCGGSASSAAPTAGSLGSAADYDYQNFTYSTGIDENGMWQDVRALDYVTLPEDYQAVTVALADIEPAEDEVLAQIESLRQSLATTEAVEDRPAQEGDIVTIAYTGRVDGVEFTGGSSEGYDLTLGSGSFIDTFEQQVEGHSIGEPFTVTVTFPEGYGDSTDADGNPVPLSGKEAVFDVTINAISVTVLPDVTDAWVQQNLGEMLSLQTVEELNTYVHDTLYQNNLTNAVFTSLMQNSTFSGIPQAMQDYQAMECLRFYADMADMYGMELDEFVQAYAGYDTADELLQSFEEDIRAYGEQALLYQALAEALDVQVSDEVYQQYAAQEETYGKNYLMQYALINEVTALCCQNANVV